MFLINYKSLTRKNNLIKRKPEEYAACKSTTNHQNKNKYEKITFKAEGITITLLVGE